MASDTPDDIDTVIIGSGPSALILSYVLHGYIPYYKGGHPDALLHAKLSKRPNLLDLTPDLYAHFQSSLRYSTQALPVNTFLDTLLRPNADTEVNPRSCVEWRRELDKAVPHVLLGIAANAGGQWAEDTMAGSDDIGTLSYAEMLSLPGYTFADHFSAIHHEAMPDFTRPSRREVAHYLSSYPAAVGITDTLRNSAHVDRVSRTDHGFLIEPQNIRCNHVVLASGIFSINLPPPPQLVPMAKLHGMDAPLLVVGSGFSAADVIISAPPARKIIHLFKWAPDTHPSPLRGCHHQAYPEYAGIYRQMKLAAMAHSGVQPPTPSAKRRADPFLSQRDWASVYEGLPNAEILTVETKNGRAHVLIRLEDGCTIQRDVGEMDYVVGRRGSLNYLSEPLFAEVLGRVANASSTTCVPSQTLISGRTLRRVAEMTLEVAPSTFIIGSLAGDSLIRHAFGTCVSVASKLITRNQIHAADIKGKAGMTMALESSEMMHHSLQESHPSSSAATGASVMKTAPIRQVVPAKRLDHQDLHLDRRKLKRSLEVDILVAENEVWQRSGWWGGLCRLA